MSAEDRQDRDRSTAGRTAARRTAAAVESALALLDAADGERVVLADLAAATGVSPHHLQRTFTRIVGCSPAAYQLARRSQALKSGLREGGDVSSAAYLAGFGSSRGLHEQGTRALGMTPGTYRRGGEGMEIAFDVLPSSLGAILVAGTARGVCAVYLGDDAEALERELRSEFPRAAIVRDPARVRPWAKETVRRAAGEAAAAEVPLDLAGTSFQLRVWHALAGIPLGQTRTYSQVAQEIGQPTAVRAVARACATNQVALLVPCHRVVRSDGTLSGYRWGVDRKRSLLRAEDTHAEEAEPRRGPGSAT